MIKHELIEKGTVDKVVFEYFRQGNKKVGVIMSGVLKTNPNEVVLGWSKCNFSAGDEFDKKRGIDIAINRIVKKKDWRFVPDSMDNMFVNFIERISRYYKDKTFYEYNGEI